jgi:hypothetical protein
MKSLNRKWWVFLFFAVLLSVPSFLKIVRPGFFPMQDSMQVFRLFELDKCVNDLQLPCRWIPDGGYGYGYPQFNFYAPLVYYLGEIIHLGGLQFIDSIKVLFALGFILSAVTMFILIKELFGGFSAFVASVLYIYVPYRAQQVYVRGALSEFWASVFFPLILWAIYKLIKNGDKKYIVWTALSIAGLFLTHNILAYLFIPIILFWILFWAFIEKGINVKRLSLSLGLGIGLSAFFVLPMFFERGYVHVETLLGGYFDYRQHFVNLKQLFFSNHWGYGSSMLGPVDDLALSVGIVHWIVGAISLILALIIFKKNKKLSLLVLGMGVIEVVVLFLMHERSSFIWSAIPPLSWLQFPWRFLSLSAFILSFLSGFIFMYLGKVRYIFGILTIVAVFVLHLNFFAPKAWLDIKDSDELSGEVWTKQLTASIFDYLPIYAKLPPNTKAPDVPEILSGSATFENYVKGSNFQTGKLDVKENARIRIPLFDFPGMVVTLDNKIISHINNDCTNEPHCLGLITIDVPVGEYYFKVKLNNTPVRVIGNTLSLFAIMGIVYVSIKKNAEISKK